MGKIWAPVKKTEAGKYAVWGTAFSGALREIATAVVFKSVKQRYSDTKVNLWARIFGIYFRERTIFELKVDKTFTINEGETKTLKISPPLIGVGSFGFKAVDESGDYAWNYGWCAWELYMKIIMPKEDEWNFSHYRKDGRC